jgi:hypothetical protein
MTNCNVCKPTNYSDNVEIEGATHVRLHTSLSMGGTWNGQKVTPLPQTYCGIIL